MRIQRNVGDAVAVGCLFVVVPSVLIAQFASAVGTVRMFLIILEAVIAAIAFYKLWRLCAGVRSRTLLLTALVLVYIASGWSALQIARVALYDSAVETHWPGNPWYWHVLKAQETCEWGCIIAVGIALMTILMDAVRKRVHR